MGARGPRAGHLVRALHRAVRVGAPLREVVSRWEAERVLQLRRQARRCGAGGQGRVLLGGRAGGRPQVRHVRGSPAGDHTARERAAGAGRPEGHAGGDLHGDGAGAADRDARVRADRGAAHGRLRRFLGRVALLADERHGVRGADHAGRGMAARHDRAAEGDRRRGSRRSTRRPVVRGATPDGRRGSDDRGPRRLVARRSRSPTRRARASRWTRRISCS